MLAILAAAMLAASPEHDTVLTADGGRVIGTVLDESPQSVAMRLLDGTFRRIPGCEVSRIEYADGSVSLTPAEPATPLPADAPPPYTLLPTYTPPPEYTPQPPVQDRGPEAQSEPLSTLAPPQDGAPAPPQGRGPARSVWGAAGLGGTLFGGDVEAGLNVGRVLAPQMSLSFEGGRMVSPHLGLALYLDMGYGGAGRDVRDYCSTYGMRCWAETIRFGAFLRETFMPGARATPWLGVGTGIAYGHVAAVGGEDVLEYWGWEVLRLASGVDFRATAKLTVGPYLGLSYIRYLRYEDAGGALAVPSTSTHSAFVAGVRVTFWQ